MPTYNAQITRVRPKVLKGFSREVMRENATRNEIADTRARRSRVRVRRTHNAR